MSVTELKSHCLEILSQLAKTGEPMILTKRGKPFVIVGSPPPGTKSRILPGLFKDQAKIIGDIISPIGNLHDILHSRS